jgi:hypothetical protein
MGHELPGPPATTIDNKLTILPPSARRLRRADGGRGSPVHGIRSPRSNKAPDTFGYPPLWRRCHRRLQWRQPLATAERGEAGV